MSPRWHPSLGGHKDCSVSCANGALPSVIFGWTKAHGRAARDGPTGDERGCAPLGVCRPDRGRGPTVCPFCRTSVVDCLRMIDLRRTVNRTCTTAQCLWRWAVRSQKAQSQHVRRPSRGRMRVDGEEADGSRARGRVTPFGVPSGKGRSSEGQPSEGISGGMSVGTFFAESASRSSDVDAVTAANGLKTTAEWRCSLGRARRDLRGPSFAGLKTSTLLA